MPLNTNIENHAGFEGSITIDGVDYDVTDGSGTITTTGTELFGTGDYNITTDRAWGRQLRGRSSFTGSLSFNADKNKPPANLVTGINATVDMKTNSGIRLQGGLYVEAKTVGGWGGEGPFTINVSFKNNGSMTETAV